MPATCRATGTAKLPASSSPIAPPTKSGSSSRSTADEGLFQGPEAAAAHGGRVGGGPAREAAAHQEGDATVSGELGAAGRILRVRRNDRGMLRPGDPGGDGCHRERRRTPRRLFGSEKGSPLAQRHGALCRASGTRQGQGIRRRGGS